MDNMKRLELAAEDNGEALRLAMDFGITIGPDYQSSFAVVVAKDEDMEHYALERVGNDQCAAARRAIVRVASEIMKAV